MDRPKRIICRFCFKIQDDFDNFRAIDEDLKDLLDKVLQNLDFAGIQNPVMCTNCADTLVKCFDFKQKCINTHDYITPFINKDTVKLDLIDVYVSKNGNGTDVLAEYQGVCGLCLSPVENCSALSVGIEEDNALKGMIEQCIPELDMDIIKKPVICQPCHDSLGNCFHFLTNCLMVEEQIKKYSESRDIYSNGGIDLSRLENQFRGEIKNADETGIANGSDIIKFEPHYGVEHSERFKLKSDSDIDTNELTLNNKEHSTPKTMLASKGVIKIEEPLCKENGLKGENLVEMDDQKFWLNEEVDIKTEESDFNSFEEPKVSKGNLKLHSPMHEDPSEVTMYKCESCSFQTKHKCHLKTHFLVHKDPSELKMYKCDTCSFQTKHKKNIANHLLLHKDPSEVTMYKCYSCSYQAKCKRNLQRHLLTHKVPLKVTTYKCDSCSYQTKHKGNLSKHLVMHVDPSTMYKCDSCPYQAKSKKNLQSHLLKHRDPSEVKMYKCDFCSYQTRHKGDVKGHYFLKHKDPSEITIYKCDSCSYQTKYKANFKSHLLKHKNPSEVTMYKCESCSFQTKYKNNIAVHSQMHKDPSEVTMYKCESCSFQTKYKHNLYTHSLMHKDPSIYKCDFCWYRTNIKRNLQRHLLKHKDSYK